MLNLESNIMITYTSHKFNKINEKFIQILQENKINIYDSEQNISDNIIQLLQNYLITTLESSNNFVSAPCPKCGKKHLLPIQSVYQRNIIFKVSNLLIHLKIPIFRMKCFNCGSTHAVLPNFCVPFKQYSKQAILEIVIEADNATTEMVANNLEIEPKQVRRMVNLVKNYKNSILHISKIYQNKFVVNIDVDTNLGKIIRALPDIFDELYFKEFKTIFLYTHKKRKIYIHFKKLSI